MKTIINIPPAVYSSLRKHLLPDNHEDEEAAFIYVGVSRNEQHVQLEYRDWYAVQPSDYESRSAFHFELKHGINGQIIKRAHDLDAAIIEFHSHIKQEYVRFSHTDWMGFSEFVPHVLWRLKGRPYVAVVVTLHGFDALVWMDNFEEPGPLSIIRIGETEIAPTNNSLKQGNNGW